MAAIARIPLNPAGTDPWEGFAAQLVTWVRAQQIALRDTVVLLPFSALLAPARAAFARRGGWQPRIETSRTLAATLGPGAAAQAMRVSFEVPADRLVAARLLREQSIGQVLARRDPRRFDRAVGALVETAQALARAAHEQAPARREGWWAEARACLAPTA